MGGTGKFDGKAVTVVGGGAGLGRQYCLDLAREGAHVVVAGRGQSAHDVADEITAAGGSAVACIADVREGPRIMQAAMEAHGRIDGLVVNAGILRDRSFHKMTDEDWHEIFDVHVHGTYSCVRAAWPILREQGHGRIVLTTTSGAMFGNFGQANYLAAKGAILSLTQTLAIEGAPRGIAVNAIAPIAMTRLTAPIFDERMQREMPVTAVSPFVLALLHPDSRENGAIIEAGGGWAAKLRWERSRGQRFGSDMWNVGDVLAQWNEVVRFDEHATHPASTDESLAACLGDAMPLRREPA